MDHVQDKSGNRPSPLSATVPSLPENYGSEPATQAENETADPVWNPLELYLVRSQLETEQEKPETGSSTDFNRGTWLQSMGTLRHVLNPASPARQGE